MSSSGGINPLAVGVIGGLLANVISEKNRSSETTREARELRHREYLEYVETVGAAQEAERKAAEEAQEEEASLREQLMSVLEERRAIRESLGLPPGRVRSVEDLLDFYQMLDEISRLNGSPFTEEQFDALEASVQQRYEEHWAACKEIDRLRALSEKAEIERKFCNQCGGPTPDTAKFCTHCGVQRNRLLEDDQETFCTQCGRHLFGSGARFCTYCGAGPSRPF